MAIGDKYRVTLVQNWKQSVPVIHNVFFYEEIVPGSPSGAEQLAVTFNFYVVPVMQDLQSDNVRYVQLLVENVVPSADNYTLSYVPATDSGAQTGDSLPPQMGWTFKLNRTTREVRNGRKTVCGITEGDNDDGVAAAGTSTRLTAMSTILAAAISPGGGNPLTYQPRIWRRFRAAQPDHVPPLASVPEAYFPIATVQYTHIGTQNSRSLY